MIETIFFSTNEDEEKLEEFIEHILVSFRNRNLKFKDIKNLFEKFVIKDIQN